MADRSLTVYVGGILEETHSGGAVTVTKYYQAFGRTVAMRVVTGTSGIGQSGSHGGTLSFLLADHLGGTVGIVDSATGAVTRQQYWPYGAVRSGGVTQTDKLYTGQQTEPGDSALGLYNYKARFYSTVTGRFVSADPSTSDGYNRYAYARNNPLRYSDPPGLDAASDLRALAAAFATWQGWGGTLEGFLNFIEFSQNLEAISSGLIEVTSRPLRQHPALATDAARYGYASVDSMIADVITNGILVKDTWTGKYMYVKVMPDGTAARVTFTPRPAGQGIEVFSAETGMKASRVEKNGESGRWKEVDRKYNPREGGPPPPLKDDEAPPGGGQGSGGDKGKPWYKEIFEGIQTVFSLPGTGDGTCAETSACN